MGGCARPGPARRCPAVPVLMPSYHGDVREHSIRIVALAEGADPAELTFPLRIGRDPNRP